MKVNGARCFDMGSGSVNNQISLVNKHDQPFFAPNILILLYNFTIF